MPSPDEFVSDIEKMKQDFKKAMRFVVPGLGLLLLVGFILSSFYTVEPDEEAVVIRFGDYHTTAQPGLHFKLPFGVDQVIKVKTRQVLQTEFGYRTQDTSSRRSEYSQRNYKDESLMLTGDLNVADVEWAVQYQIADPFKFIFQTSEPVRNIRDVSESIMRRVVGDRSVAQILTTGRVEINDEAKILMQEVFDRYDMGVRIISVRLQDVNPPDRVKPSFNEVNAAKQEQETAINQAEEVYNKVVPEARGKAEQTISEAEGFAERVVNRALGDVQRFEALLKEYQRAPTITRKRMYLETMESIFKDFKNLTLVDPNLEGVLPVYKGLEGMGQGSKK